MTGPGTWKVFIEKTPADLTVKVYLIHSYGSRNSVTTIDPNTSLLKMTEFKDGDTVLPLMTLPPQALQAISDAFVEAVPPTKQERVEAELEATKRHLEDLRRIVFKEENKKTYVLGLPPMSDTCTSVTGHEFISDDNPNTDICKHCGATRKKAKKV